MIKASAIAGAAAWTAPVIIDSIASPAAALSGGINLSGPSYAMIVFDKGGVRYVVKITKTVCSATGNGFGGDIPDGINFGTCSGTQFGTGSGKLVALSGTAI